jgi:hypothetical protein
MGKWRRLAEAEVIEKDRLALDRIAEIISENEWSSDLCEPIIDQVLSTGRVITDADDESNPNL